MIVDAHTHLWEHPEQLGDGTAQQLKAKMMHEPINASGWAYDQAMKPVDASFILGFESQYLGASISNEQVANYVKRRPHKYLGFAGIDPLASNWQDKLKEAVDLGLVGVCFSAAAQNCHPTHTQAMLLYEKCEALGMPILHHPGTHMATSAVMAFSQPFLFDEVGRCFPKLKFILSQLGHPWVDEAILLLSKHPNFYADLSDISSRPWQLYNTLLTADQQNVTDSLLLGSDFPFSSPEQVIYNLYTVNHYTKGTSMPTIPRHVLTSIIERDTLAMLGLADKITITSTRVLLASEETQDTADMPGKVTVIRGDAPPTVTDELTLDLNLSKDENATP
ncbi:MAG: amidohydrolase family protein [Phycisphaeraceae bacterium]|nr:amidohydrolase family protein [Phycisphaeraceae bacterium]